MDADENEVPDSNLYGFPTIKFYPKFKKRDSKLFGGAKTQLELENWINEMMQLRNKMKPNLNPNPSRIVHNPNIWGTRTSGWGSTTSTNKIMEALKRKQNQQ